MSNGISRASVHEHLRANTSRDGVLDLWGFARDLADDVESWGENFDLSPMEATGQDVPRYFQVIPYTPPPKDEG